MAYQTGTAANSSALQTIVQSFAIANGWTTSIPAISLYSNSSSVRLNKGNSHIELSNWVDGNPYYPSYNISLTGGTTQVTCTTYPKNLTGLLTTGQSLTVIGENPIFNGTFTITVTDAHTFKYNLPTSLSASTINSRCLFNSPEVLTIVGAVDSTSAATYPTTIEIPTNAWPVTYHLSAHTNPDIVVCAINYNVLNMQYIVFGDIVKVHNSAYVGGNFYWGSKGFGGVNASSSIQLTSISDDYLVGNYYSGGNGSPIPFMSSASYTTSNNLGAFIHAEIDNIVWKKAGYSSPTTEHAFVTKQVISQLFRSPNSWNSQAQLVPIHLQAFGGSGYFHYLGYIEHIRLVRIDNYNLGDIITIGSDKWKVFPCLLKDTVNRNGLTTTTVLTNFSGTLGYAIRYDGP